MGWVGVDDKVACAGGRGKGGTYRTWLEIRARGGLLGFSRSGVSQVASGHPPLPLSHFV